MRSISVTDLFRLAKESIHFEALWEQAKQRIEDFGGKVWTDTGEHDPGVTFMEGYSYGTSDLAYRHTLPLADLLTPPVEQQTEGDGVFPADFGPQMALTCGPITIDDYRRAVLDLTDDKDTFFLVRNVQLIPLNTPGNDYTTPDYVYYFSNATLEFSFTKPADESTSVSYNLRGNYRAYYEASRDSDNAGYNELSTVQSFFNDHRNLCESLTHLNETIPETINPLATIELEEGVQDYARVYAEIFRTADDYISPFVGHETARTLQQRGMENGDIYQGPDLLHGWQPTLPPSVDYTNLIEVNLSGLASRWLAIDGVRSVVSLSFEGGGPADWHWTTSQALHSVRLWGGDALTLMLKSVRLVTQDGNYVTASEEDIEAELTAPVVEEIPAVVLPYGKARNLSQYYPVSDKIPACYGLQQAPVAGGPQGLFQFLLPFEQALANSCKQLAMLPQSLSFERKGDTVWGAQWPYADGSAGDLAHAAYKDSLEDETASKVDDYDQELKLLDYLLNYFGTQRASRMLNTSADEFLSVEQSYLGEITTLAYERDNIRVDQVSAFQKRLAARMGFGLSLFSDTTDMSALPFYLVEHRALFPRMPVDKYSTAIYPTALELSSDGRTLTVTSPPNPPLDELASGQLIDFILLPDAGGITVQGLIVDEVDSVTQQFTLQLDASPQLELYTPQVIAAQQAGELTWQNSDVWLREIAYPLNYASGTADPPVDPVVLAIPAPFPFPAAVRPDDKLSIDLIPSPGSDPWSMNVVVKSVDDIGGTVTVTREEPEAIFPSPSAATSYVWHTLNVGDRFSMIVSLVLNKSVLPSTGDSQATEDWIKQCAQAEIPAHISLMMHWLSSDISGAQSFASFARTYAEWQDKETAPSTATFQLLWKLGLGQVPFGLEVGIGAMIVATAEQQTAVLGPDGNEWNTDVIVQDSLFFVPKIGVTSVHAN